MGNLFSIQPQRRTFAVSQPGPNPYGITVSDTGGISSEISDRLIRSFTPLRPLWLPKEAEPNAELLSIEIALFDALASFKVYVATVAMHIEPEDRERLFRQLDRLLDKDEWDVDDTPPSLASFRTFMRLMLSRRPDRRPSIGASMDGHLIAAWQNQNGRLTVECLAEDRFRWSVVVIVDGKVAETASGETILSRFGEVLQPYAPSRWIG